MSAVGAGAVLQYWQYTQALSSDFHRSTHAQHTHIQPPIVHAPYSKCGGFVVSVRNSARAASIFVGFIVRSSSAGCVSVVLQPLPVAFDGFVAMPIEFTATTQLQKTNHDHEKTPVEATIESAAAVVVAWICCT